MAISKKMGDFVANGSMIRKMFEEGKRLKSIYGEDKVFDFSIGNPNVPPPPEFKKALASVVEADEPDLHAYMPNAGLPEARAAIAGRIARDQGVKLAGEQVVVTCGAAAALNIVFKALLEPGEEVLVSSPYFVEYGFIADNHGGVLKTAPTLPDFGLDVDALEAAMGPRTKVVLVNTPNNPSGRIYSEESLAKLAAAMERKGRELGRTIYLVSDEPYRKLAYGGAKVPSPMARYANSIIVSSFSKDLSLPGERIGFAAVNPAAEGAAEIVAALSLANRILGFVNAPSLMQKAIALVGDACVDVSIYERKRDRLVSALRSSGYELGLPEGAFYLFVKIPGANDAAFLDLLKEENILVVPGSGFGAPGYFRVAYCVEDKVIDGALSGFDRAMRKARG
jgi:Aspartate/tyrosine/aromatic aminotransferase